MTDAAAQVEAAKKALAEAEAALAAATAAAAAATPAVVGPVETPSVADKTSSTDGPLTADEVASIRAGYAFDGPALEMGDRKSVV